jgi:hypothetical protein
MQSTEIWKTGGGIAADGSEWGSIVIFESIDKDIYLGSYSGIDLNIALLVHQSQICMPDKILVYQTDRLSCKSILPAYHITESHHANSKRANPEPAGLS